MSRRFRKRASRPRRFRRELERHRRCNGLPQDRKSTRLNSSHSQISYAVFCLKKKKHTTLICIIALILACGWIAFIYTILLSRGHSKLRPVGFSHYPVVMIQFVSLAQRRVL